MPLRSRRERGGVPRHIQMTLRIFKVQQYYDTGRTVQGAGCTLQGYGFIFPSSEIYDGLAAVYDYGQMGVELKNNIKQYWWNAMTRLNENIVGIDSCVFMHPKTWVASGHVAAFNDPLIDNKDSRRGIAPTT